MGGERIEPGLGFSLLFALRICSNDDIVQLVQMQRRPSSALHVHCHAGRFDQRFSGAWL